MPASGPLPTKVMPASAAISITSRPPRRQWAWRTCSLRPWRRPASATTPSTSTIRTSATTCSPSRALREEYLEIHNAGVVLQVDDAVLANMYDHLVEQSPQRYREWAELRIAALNHALQDIPEDRVRYHVCFGSWHVPHVADAPLEDIVDLILKVRAGAYSIEAANVRHEHEWTVWRKVKLPAGKILIPGVVTHHTTTVEHPQLIANRIITFAELVGRENVIAGTDCGFAQAQDIQRVHPQVMWAKLESLAEGAGLASKELWGR